eukprot:scaffold7243_cov394-Prasinococcus_capsulatus_cf.AAC.3
MAFTRQSASSLVKHRGGLIRNTDPWRPPWHPPGAHTLSAQPAQRPPRPPTLPIKTPMSLIISRASAHSEVAGSFVERSRTSSTPSMRPWDKKRLRIT